MILIPTSTFFVPVIPSPISNPSVVVLHLHRVQLLYPEYFKNVSLGVSWDVIGLLCSLANTSVATGVPRRLQAPPLVANPYFFVLDLMD